MSDQGTDKPATAPEATPTPPRKRRHRWLRITLKTLMWVIIAILLIPVLVYIPPVQDLLKDVACKVVRDKTGMNVQIERFRLRFPLDVQLDKVCVVEATGDTMVRARELIADVKLLPLLKLDVKVNRLDLTDGYFRMVSPDSSLIMKIAAGRLRVDDKSSVNIKGSEILLNRVTLADGDVSLFMDVWKKKPSPPDTTSQKFYIRANDLQVKNITFAMSMLPTIDTLRLQAGDLNLREGVIDLRKNDIHLGYAAVGNGDFTYLTPTPQFVKAHPVPKDTISGPSEPMTIRGDSVRLYNFNALYAMKGAKPQPGFDPSYIQVSGIDVTLAGLFNRESTVKLPIAAIAAKERCGLQITSGSGTIGIDSIGLQIADLNLNTTRSRIKADADIPFEMMALKPDAKMEARLDCSLGLGDLTAFMPALSTYTRAIPNGTPLNVNLDARGSLASLKIPRLDVDLPRVLKIKASGFADNPLDFKRMVASVDFHGSLSNPGVAQSLTGGLGFDIPTFTLDGTARVNHETYFADFDLLSSAGDLAAVGHVSLNAESYDVNASIRDINVAHFLPDIGIGRVTATVTANGAGFNPTRPGAHTDALVEIASIEYGGRTYTGIQADAMLGNHDYIVHLISNDPVATLDIDARGTIADDLYTVDLAGNIGHLDLREMGFTPDTCNGSAYIALRGSASPNRWLYDVDLTLDNLDWNLGESIIHMPRGAHAYLLAEADNVQATVDSELTSLRFTSATGLKNVVDDFLAATTMVQKQIDDRQLDIEEIQKTLPPFDLALNASGRGLLNRIISAESLTVDTIFGHFSNTDTFAGHISAIDVTSGTTALDTISLSLAQRGKLLDYKAHMGNRPGTMDEFADVNANGYVGGNRASLYLNQKNIAGETGYRLGLTAALQDSTVSIHFTPLKATIAYLPWTLNADNYIDYSFNRHMEANLLAKSNESSIMLRTEPTENGDTQLHAQLQNIKVQDFLHMYLQAPPVAATVNSDIIIYYHGTTITGNGSLGIKDLTYQKQKMGDFDLKFDAGLDFAGDTEAHASLLVNGTEAITASGKILSNPGPDDHKNQFGVSLNRFPLEVLNPFLGKDVAQLHGALNGDLSMMGDFTAPVLNGNVVCDSVRVFLPIAGSSLKFDDEPLTMTDNVLKFNKFDIWAQNDNPITIDGTVDAKKLNNMIFDVDLQGTNVLLVNNDRRAHSDLYGKIYLTASASAKGPMTRMDVNARLNVLNSTDAYYQVPEATQALAQVSKGENVVKFVQFSDTTTVAKTDSLSSPINMRINAGVNIANGTQVTVILSSNGTDRLEITPSGNLTYFQNYMGDMSLNGQLNLGSGFVRYAIPVMGEKKFVFEPNSYINWGGDILNPNLHILAYDDVKAAVSTSAGNSQPITFKVSLSLTNHLSQPSILFDLSTNEDITIANELQSMTADQRNNQAMNMLITGQYMGPSAVTGGKMDFNATGQLYSFLTSTLNSWAANNIRGVDLTFGVDQYDRTVNGESSSSTSYSYQLSKSLFNNKFKIVVGGNYSTDASADENFSQNLVNDISFEYMLRQSNNLSMYLTLFRHTDFESVLEGEVTETGLGFVMRRRLSNLRSLFRMGRRNRNAATQRTDSTSASPDSTASPISTKN